MSNLSAKAKQKISRLECFAMFPYLIEVTLASGTVYRYANCDKDINYNDNGTLKTFLAGWFDIDRPEEKENEISNGTLTVSSIDDTFKSVIRTEGKRATIRFVATILYDDNNSIETIEPIEDREFTLTDASWNDTSISWTMVFDVINDVTIPCDEATSVKCPMCV